MMVKGVAQAVLACATLLVVGGLLLIAAAMLPTLAGYTSYIVRSGSMEPSIPTGATVVGQKVPPESLHEGDIITFYPNRDQDNVVTHRLIRIERQDERLALKTKGDANSQEDMGQVDLRAPVARVVYWVPWAGYILAYAADPGARMVLAGAGLVVLSLWSRVRIRRESADTRDREAQAERSASGG